MKKVMRWGTCMLLLCFAVAFGPVFGQQAFAQTTFNASDVEGSALTLEDDTVLNMDKDLKLSSIVSDKYDLTIKGEGTLQVNNKDGQAIDVDKLKLAGGLEVAEPEGAKVEKGTVVNKKGEPVDKVVISASQAFNAEPDGDEGGEPGGGSRALVTVTFDVQGHGVTPEAETVNEGGTVSKPEDPKADCYAFKGWFDEPECSTEHDFTQAVNSDITVYAKWETAHTVEKIAAKDATCTEDGNIECWQCSVCKEYFKAEAATDDDKISESEVVVKAKGHNASHYTKTAATCTESGNIEYWHCSVCNKYFTDEALTKSVSKSDTVIAAAGHKMKHAKAKAATCTKDGHKEYWHCSVCGKYFSDKAGKKAIKKSATTIAKTGHDWGEWKVVKEATTTQKGLQRRVCKNNSKHIQEQEIPIVIDYTFTKGANSTWTKGTNSGLEIDLKRNVDDDKTYDLFKGLSVDDKVVDPKNYTVSKGGLKLTLKQTYLENLAVGNHKVKFSFDDADVTTTLTIKAKDSSSASSSSSSSGKTANTGDSIPVAAVIGIIFVAAAALAGIFVARRRMN